MQPVVLLVTDIYLPVAVVQLLTQQQVEPVVVVQLAVIAVIQAQQTFMDNLLESVALVQQLLTEATETLVSVVLAVEVELLLLEQPQEMVVQVFPVVAVVVLATLVHQRKLAATVETVTPAVAVVLVSKLPEHA
jgi:hypothetical protein